MKVQNQWIFKLQG